ncbi:MAG: hypothetical protein KIT14_11840 [bacterium]|nr:hypothetical protein [bacterium]
MPPADGAPYIELPQDRFPLPPYTLGTSGRRCGFESHGFFCNVDHPAALGVLCERMLNTPLQGRHDVRFVPAGDLLLVTVNRYRGTGGRSPYAPGAAPADYRMPSVPYLEFCFMVPVRNVRDPRHERRLFWFMPLVYIAPYVGSRDDPDPAPVDDASVHAIITGREVYGFPKAPSRITYDVHGGDCWATLAALVPDAGGTMRYQQICDVRPKPDLPPAGPMSRQEGLQRLLTAVVTGPEQTPVQWSGTPEGALVAKTTPTSTWHFDRRQVFGAPLLTLKQQRDPRNPERAAYQAVVATPLDVMDMSCQHETARDHVIDVSDPAGQGIWEQLGLDAAHDFSADGQDSYRESASYHLLSWLSFGDPARTTVWPIT